MKKAFIHHKHFSFLALIYMTMPNGNYLKVLKNQILRKTFKTGIFEIKNTNFVNIYIYARNSALPSAQLWWIFCEILNFNAGKKP